MVLSSSLLGLWRIPCLCVFFYFTRIHPTNSILVGYNEMKWWIWPMNYLDHWPLRIWSIRLDCFFFCFVVFIFFLSKLCWTHKILSNRMIESFYIFFYFKNFKNTTMMMMMISITRSNFFLQSKSFQNIWLWCRN